VISIHRRHRRTDRQTDVIRRHDRSIAIQHGAVKTTNNLLSLTEIKRKRKIILKTKKIETILTENKTKQK